MIQFLDKTNLNDTELCQVQGSTKVLDGENDIGQLIIINKMGKGLLFFIINAKVDNY